ncbi:MAG: NAD(P)-dependent oxidoreductase [Candidatus Omnitrophica bacterium]|nr:NAD(P)-dependent oxidoreductase [Candidatus Omnitrophota bacterium]
MKIVITGATGFIGRRLQRSLSGADEIAVVCRKAPAGLAGKLRVIEGDLNEPDSLEGALKAFRPDACVHLAWEGIPDYGFEMSRRNLGQGTALFRLLTEECGCRKIVSMGSCWEYGQSYGACREDVLAPVNSYFAWAKRSLCDFGMTLAAKNGTSFIWLRGFFIYGPGQKETSLIPVMASALLRGETPVIRTPWNANDFIYVDDVSEAIVRAVKEEIPSGAYNLGTGAAVNVWKVCMELEKAMGRRPVQAAALEAARTKATADFWADTSRARTIFGWRARTGIESGIRQYLKSLEVKV